VCCLREVTEILVHVTLLEFGPAEAHACGRKSGIKEIMKGSKLVFSSMAQQPLVSQGLLVVEELRSHLETRQSVGFLWTSDQPDAQNST